MAELVVQHLSKSYPTPGDPLVVLEDISLEMSLGENLAIVGPSGSGKSTLLQIIGTLDRPTSGSIRLQGQDPFQLSEPNLARFRNQRIGFVFQDHHLLPQLTAWENVLVPTLAQSRPSDSVVERAEQLLSRVGLTNRRNHRPAELSGGERQRVAIARALIEQPLLLMADEPTGNLDRKTADSITDLLLELQQNTTTPTMMIVVTHSATLASSMQNRRQLESGRLT
jgi:lipoprotein-releasing system ATP-binding protein